MLTFDEPSHTYKWSGAIVPSVTQILQPLTDWSMVPPDVLEHARNRGVAAHRLIELDLAGDLDESSVHGELLGFMEQWRGFRAATQFNVEHSELRLYSKKYGYAGTLDLYGSTAREESVLIDTKTGVVMRSAGPQLAAYAQLLIENGYCARCSRRVLSLKENAWKLSSPYTDSGDLRVFLACLTLHNFLKDN